VYFTINLLYLIVTAGTFVLRGPAEKQYTSMVSICVS